MRKKTYVVFFFKFHFVQLYIFTLQNPILCQHRPEHSLGISLKLDKIINQNKAIAYTYMKYDKF